MLAQPDMELLSRDKARLARLENPPLGLESSMRTRTRTRTLTLSRPALPEPAYSVIASRLRTSRKFSESPGSQEWPSSSDHNGAPTPAGLVASARQPLGSHLHASVYVHQVRYALPPRGPNFESEALVQCHVCNVLQAYATWHPGTAAVKLTCLLALKVILCRSSGTQGCSSCAPYP